jgi:hypothetical protein
LPEVECVSDGDEEAASTLPAGQGESTSVRRIVIELTRELSQT